ncbi:preprotein translocase subunit SecE [Desulfotruncus alcoholivorax]|uniref:preprotein translocase subunit SecE n=1 Tax=Desulfotruncus alcoholivorax TaxID=265477 RepID=UPI00041AE7A9|nr:preprotein translocase subunit SecE [Desulfotruncus alcoholivorax]
MAEANKLDKSNKKGKNSGKELVKKDRKEPVKKAAVNKPNRIENAKTYIRGVMNELKKVHWPNRRETAIYTSVVLVSVVFVGVLIWVFDALLGAAMNVLIK